MLSPWTTLPLLAALAAPAALAPPVAQDNDEARRAALVEGLGQAGVHLDFEAQAVTLRSRVLVRTELLEYLLVGPGGAAHESLFVTDIQPSLLNAGMIALGVEPGKNAAWEPVEPPPTLEERRAGKRPYRVFPPEGDGFYLYAAWREGEETFFFRVEDLVANLQTGRTMRRHRWVYLGSSFLKDENGQDVFAADVEGNLINISFFREGHTLMTPALEECEDQSIWMSNAWLVPPRDAEVELIFARKPLAELPEGWLERLPVVTVAEGDPGGDEPEDG